MFDVTILKAQGVSALIKAYTELMVEAEEVSIEQAKAMQQYQDDIDEAKRKWETTTILNSKRLTIITERQASCYTAIEQLGINEYS